MRIAVWHNLPSGGGKRALYDHVTGLVARGHMVEAWCPPTADRSYLPLSDLVREHVVDLALPSIRLTDKLGLTLSTKRQIEAMDAHCRSCAREIDNGGFDILFANACLLFRAASIGRFARTPSVVYLGEPYRSLYEAQPTLWWLARPRHSRPVGAAERLKTSLKDVRALRNRRLQAREEVDNAAAFRRILVNSHFSRESLLRAYGLDSEICYLGINTDLFVDQQLERTDTVVGLGSIRREKNVRLCIEALASVRPPRPSLVWVGNVASPAYMAEMVALAQERGVHFEPKVRIADSELLAILNRARAMFYAPHLEPFGLAPLEANACGTPVIAVAEGGVRETVIDGVTGLLTSSDPQSLGKAIELLTRTPQLARELGTNARQNVLDRWSMKAAIDRLEGQLMRFAEPRAEAA